MPNLPEKKVGIVACSGEEMPEGLISRLTALQVLEEHRKGQTVTICLPLFLAGGAGDRAFAKFYPTIALDGCEKRCAAAATEMYSNKPAASFVVTDFIQAQGLPAPHGLRHLDAGGQQTVTALAEAVAAKVDELMAVRWSRTKGDVLDSRPSSTAGTNEGATCACGSNIPVTTIAIAGQTLQFLALTSIFDMAYAQGLRANGPAPEALLAMVRLYNPTPDGQETLYVEAVTQAWTDYNAAKASAA